MSNDNDDTWSEWSRHVLGQLEKLTTSSDELKKTVENFRLEIARDVATKSEVSSLRDNVSDLGKRISEVVIHSSRDRTELAKVAELEKRIIELKAEIQYKAGMTGAISGAIPAIVAIIILLVKYALTT